MCGSAHSIPRRGFDLNGNQVNARRDEFTAARHARTIQLALRFQY